MSGTRRFSEILSMIVGGGGVPLAIILPEFFGVKGVYLAESVADATAAICCLTIFMIFFPKIPENIGQRQRKMRKFLILPPRIRHIYA